MTCHPSAPKAHPLRKLTKVSFPKAYIFVDSESDVLDNVPGKLVHQFKLGVGLFAIYNSKQRTFAFHTLKFTARDEFWREVDQFVRKHKHVVMIAHNIAYDLQILAGRTHLEAMGLHCQYAFSRTMTFISRWSGRRNDLMLVNNGNWFGGTLARWGELLNIPKLSMPDKDASVDEWFTYCTQDAFIILKLQEFLINFLQDNALGGWRCTLASLAFSSFRYRFLSKKIRICDDEREQSLARASYHGGRTECFYAGPAPEQPYYYLDINSMYPAMMLQNEFPCECIAILKDYPPEAVESCINKYCAIADCDVIVKEPYFAYKYEGITCYPTGRLRCTLTTPELLRALQYGKISRIYSIAIYRKDEIFADFVNFFYSKRLEAKAAGNDLLAFMFKILLNSLYGKFGQHKYVDRVIGTAPPDSFATLHHYDASTGARGTIQQIGRNIIESMESGAASNAFVAVASHVTAYARCYLYDLILKAGRANTYYCDTDSLIVNQQGFERLAMDVDPTTIGKLKIEDTSSILEILAPKHYRFGDKMIRKGVGAGDPEVKANLFKTTIWPGFTNMLKMPDGIYYNIIRNKMLRPEIRSGQIISNSKVVPFNL